MSELTAIFTDESRVAARGIEQGRDDAALKAALSIQVASTNKKRKRPANPS